MELSTVAVTVRVPLAVSCAAANDGIVTRPAATMAALSRCFVLTAFLLKN